MGNHDWAEEKWIEALKQFDRCEFSKGKTLLEEILEEEPGYGRAHAFLGWYYYSIMRDFEMAEVHLTFAIKFAPQYEPAYWHYVNVLLNRKQFKKTLEVLKQAKDVPGTDREWIYMCRGKAYEALGKCEKAVKAYSVAALETEDDCSNRRYQNMITRVKKRMKKTV